MLLEDREFDIPVTPNHDGLLSYITRSLSPGFARDVVPVRFAITETTEQNYHCELGVINGHNPECGDTPDSIFRFVPRRLENQDKFNAVLVVPTGIGCELGGHAGDATPVARLLGAACDTLITHPNVVNASDLNEMPENTLYVEGSVLARMLMGTVGLARTRTNRILVVIDDHEDPEMEDSHPIFKHNAINAVNGARASGGFNCNHIVTIKPRMKMTTRYTTSGRASGQVIGFDRLCQIMDEYRSEYDAVAITTVVDVDRDLHDRYFEDCSDIVNPWGGIEAVLTHSLSSLYNVPTAHSPMYENQEIMNEDAGIMDPRLAAEGVSVAFLHCILRGLDKSPRIVTDPEVMARPGVLTAEDVSCLVVPDGCIGLPTLAALEQGIPVIAVENDNKMENDLDMLPWRDLRLYRAESYLEAVGIIMALRSGVDVTSLQRPTTAVKIGGPSVAEVETDATASGQ